MSGGSDNSALLNVDPTTFNAVRAGDSTNNAIRVNLVAGAGGGGGPATIADGADVTQGITTDAAVITDTNGTLSGKLRGLIKWAFERMPTSLGQKAMTASLPVVLASDGLGSSAGVPMFISGTINASSAATATNYQPQYTDSQSAAFSQTLQGELRVIEETSVPIYETLQAILLELRVQNTILHQTLNSRDDLDLLRNDAAQLGNLPNTIN